MTDTRGFLRAMMLTEAVNSIALEHPESCVCIACRAAHGDPDALAQLMVALADAESDA
jgi:hypothetical protein